MQGLLDIISPIGKEFALFFASMIPVFELRGSIPLGAVMGLNPFRVLVICVIGNMIPIPFIILFGKKLFEWLKKTKSISRFVIAYENKLMKKASKIMKYAGMGLCIFVAIPLPGTGAWSGALIALLLNMRLKYALPSIGLGVLIAGVIMTIGSYGILNI